MVCASGDAEAHRQLYVAAPRKVRRGWIKVHRGVAARSTQRTGAQRISYTLAAAAAACGLNKSTVLRAIKAGKISGTKDEHGEWHIEAAELHRRLPARCGRRGGQRCAAKGRNAGEHLRKKLATGLDHSKADDRTQRTGSSPTPKMIGIAEVASFAARAASGKPGVTMTATRRRTKSAVSIGSVSYRPSTHWYLTVTF